MYEATIFLGDEERICWGTGDTARQAIRAAHHNAHDRDMDDNELNSFYRTTYMRDNNLSDLKEIPAQTDEMLVIISLDRLYWPIGIVRKTIEEIRVKTPKTPISFERDAYYTESCDNCEATERTHRVELQAMGGGIYICKVCLQDFALRAIETFGICSRNEKEE
jgi:hypothetical protein